MSRARLIAVGAALAATALTAGCTASTQGAHTASTTATSAPSRAAGSPARSAALSPSAPGARAHFTGCAHSGVDIGSASVPAGLQIQCAMISVPLDYSRPNGRRIDVALVRIHKSESHPVGSLLMDPGGPGASGVQYAVSVAPEMETVLAHYDLVGFDPRGVGSSTPVRCENDAQEDKIVAASPDVRTAAGFARAKQLAAGFAHDCLAKYGAALAQFNTVQTAKDMELIRRALGDKQLNYLGFSYVTELGGQYAHLYPNRVGAMVLDGAIDPLTDDLTSDANQLEGFEQAFGQFADWCAAHDPCKQLGNPRSVVYELVATAQRKPIPSSVPGETRTATPAIVDLGVLYALYSQQLWPLLGQSLIAARGGDARGLFQLADGYTERTNGHYTNVNDASTTIGCNDSKPGPSDAKIRATAAQWVKQYPMFGLSSAPALFSCQQWQPKRTVPPLPTARASAHTILVVGNLHDPATPYQSAKDLARILGNARLLSWDGEGHTSYLQGSSCIDQRVNAFLVQGTLPAPGTTCPR
jgi:pimeloyl-ACP methyl ester carboxylesterase